MKRIFFFFLLLVNAQFYSKAQSVTGQSGKIRVIVFGAHPDDCDITAGGLAALYVSMGHAVKFVSLTNGDMGHQKMGGGELAARRLKETQEVARRLGITYEVLDTHDGELLPTLEKRFEVIRCIREWKADIVIAPRPNDYHPDHRYTGVLVQDAAYMVIVPNVLSSVPPLHDNPLFLYVSDRFERPNPFRPDIAVDISSVFAKKIDALDAHVSQFYEWLPWTEHDTTVPENAADRKKWLNDKITSWSKINPPVRKTLEKWYGAERGGKIATAEAFEICEYGISPTDADIRRLFPMLPRN
ncbi:PIG-L deacetylase family protein [Flavihumibacter profundi]|uniref:PIG-L deacetylase family protein n=1 Tax=Flavihumibacter profundi TaxID=2716883 RepID=UPI001CC3C462|nr:PIG-L family deacetylase [Flavihumibacter profundi]MBZ5856186.1 PIG-L family deacetylase [Flavihumibacter profundi]